MAHTRAQRARRYIRRTGATGPADPALTLDKAAEPRSWPAVWVLGLGTFLFVTTELLPVGLLPSIGGGVGVPISVAASAARWPTSVGLGQPHWDGQPEPRQLGQ